MKRSIDTTKPHRILHRFSELQPIERRGEFLSDPNATSGVCDIPARTFGIYGVVYKKL